LHESPKLEPAPVEETNTHVKSAPPTEHTEAPVEHTEAPAVKAAVEHNEPPTVTPTDGATSHTVVNHKPNVETHKLKPVHAHPIEHIKAVEVGFDKLVLEWPDVPDAKDYKLFWDRGNPNALKYHPLTHVPAGQTRYTLTSKNSMGLVGSKKWLEKGGDFTFKMSYICKDDGVESEMSDPYKVTVHPSGRPGE